MFVYFLTLNYDIIAVIYNTGSGILYIQIDSPKASIGPKPSPPYFNDIIFLLYLPTYLPTYTIIISFFLPIKKNYNNYPKINIKTLPYNILCTWTMPNRHRHLVNVYCYVVHCYIIIIFITDNILEYILILVWYIPIYYICIHMLCRGTIQAVWH